MTSDTNPVPAPMATDLARDLAADLVVVEAATGGPWDAALRRDGADGDADVFVPRGPGQGGPSILTTSLTGAGLGRPRIDTNANARAIALSREAWPAAIRRAIAAESRVSELEVLVAWAFGDLTEGQAAALLGCGTDPVVAREMLMATLASARSRWERRRDSKPPLAANSGPSTPNA